MIIFYNTIVIRSYITPQFVKRKETIRHLIRQIKKSSGKRLHGSLNRFHKRKLIERHPAWRQDSPSGKRHKLHLIRQKKQWLVYDRRAGFLLSAHVAGTYIYTPSANYLKRKPRFLIPLSYVRSICLYVYARISRAASYRR